MKEQEAKRKLENVPREKVQLTNRHSQLEKTALSNV